MTSGKHVVAECEHVSKWLLGVVAGRDWQGPVGNDRGLARGLQGEEREMLGTMRDNGRAKLGEPVGRSWPWHRQR